MMPINREAADGLAEDLQQRYASLVLALPDLTQELTARLDRLAMTLAVQLSSTDEAERAEAALETVTLLDPPASWWGTVQGRLTAAAYADTADGTVSYGEAAAMLGVTRGTVSNLVARGRLERAADHQGVVLASVLHRLTECTA